jgi:putative pyruvate formate lyase activating enzyme
MQNNQRIKKISALCDKLNKRLEHCDICPRECHINRCNGKIGYCKAPLKSVVYTAFKHHGEEPGISAKNGSGTIFFSGCNLRCTYCQNHRFSHTPKGTTLGDEKLAQLILKLQESGADNINLVTPTHFLPQITAAVIIALTNGLNIPIIYNTSGFEKPEITKMIEPLVDVYLTDIKYMDQEAAQKYSNASEYPEYALKTAGEMYRQKPRLITKNGKITKGLIIRHLILPNQIENSKKIMRWIKEKTPNAMASIMFQYQPYSNAIKYPEINRPVNQSEYRQICLFAEKIQLNGWIQGFTPQENLAGIHFKAGFDNIY